MTKRRSKREVAKARKQIVQTAREEKKMGVMQALDVIFLSADPPVAPSILRRVAAMTGHALKLATLQLYRSKWNCGGFPCQKGTHPKVKYPLLQTPEAK